MENKNNFKSKDEIDLVELLKIILRGKKTIIRYSIIFSLLGVFVAFFSEDEFISYTIIVPQASQSNVNGRLGGLAAMAGINLKGDASESILPSLYPEVVRSVFFQKELINTPLKFSFLDKEVTYKEYYEEYKKSTVISIITSYTIGLPRKLLKLIKGKPNHSNEIEYDSIYKVTLENSKLFKQLKKQLSIEVKKKEGFVKMSFTMPEALAAAQMAKKVQELLQKSIIKFKTQKAKEEYDFIEGRYNELKKDYQKKQLALASFRDQNQGLTTSRSQSKLEKLQTDYTLSQSIYYELAKQLETQKIQLKKNTPVFTIIEPVNIPVNRYKPKRTLVIITWGAVGFILALVFIVSKHLFSFAKLEFTYGKN